MKESKARQRRTSFWGGSEIEVAGKGGGRGGQCGEEKDIPQEPQEEGTCK